MEHPKVFDMDYKERAWDYIEEKYGVAYRRAEVAEGELVYRLKVVREKTGHTSLITQVLDQNGRPIEGVPVTFYWPDAPKPPEPPTPVYAHDWYDRFTWGLTNLNGEVGPGMGKGAYHGRGEGGPHKVWIHDPNIPSDICEKLGMLAGTFHDHCDLVFQLVSGGEPPEPEPEPEPPPPPPPPPSWSMTTEAKPGIALLIGKMPRAGIPVVVTDPRGPVVKVISGSKAEHGVGGWEINAWGWGIYTVEFEGQKFQVSVEGQTVIATFKEEEKPAQARLVSTWMDRGDAETMLQVLEEQFFPGVFFLES